MKYQIRFLDVPDKWFSPGDSLLVQPRMQLAGRCKVCRLLQIVEFVEHFDCELIVSYVAVFERHNGFFLVWFRCSFLLASRCRLRWLQKMTTSPDGLLPETDVCDSHVNHWMTAFQFLSTVIYLCLNSLSTGYFCLVRENKGKNLHDKGNFSSS